MSQGVEKVVALYDYRAQRPVEISFSKGDIISVVSSEGAWWIGELKGTKGKFPSNYVKPVVEEKVQPPPQSPAHPTTTPTATTTTPPTTTVEAPTPQTQPQQGAPSQAQTCTALFDYKAQRDVELSFKKGDVISILSQRGKWWEGELNGKRGRLPSNYVKANQPPPVVAAATSDATPAAKPAEQPKPIAPSAGDVTPAAADTMPTEQPKPIAPAAATTAGDATLATKPPDQPKSISPPVTAAPPPPPRPAHVTPVATKEDQPPPIPARAVRPVSPATVELGAPPPPPKGVQPLLTRQNSLGDSANYVPPPPPSSESPPSEGATDAPEGDEEDTKSTGSASHKHHRKHHHRHTRTPSEKGAKPAAEDAKLAIPPPPPEEIPPHPIVPAPITVPPSIAVRPPKSSSPTPTVDVTSTAMASSRARSGSMEARHQPALMTPIGIPPLGASVETGPVSARPVLGTAPDMRDRSTTVGGAMEKRAPTLAPPPFLAVPGGAAGAPAAAAAAAGRAGVLLPTAARSRFATVRLRGTPQMAGSETGSPDITDEYMSMMKWTAEYVPNLTRSLFQDPGASGKAITPTPEFIPPPPLPPPSSSLPSLADGPRQRYYIFNEPDTPANIRVNPTTGELVAATLPKVIAKLTDKDMPGKEFIQAFLMTYRNFAEPIIVLDLLSNRFDTPESLPDSLQETIQIRVWFFLKEWVANLIDDFVESSDLNVRMTNLVERMCGSPRESVAQASAQLRQLYQQKLSGATALTAPVPPFGAPKPVNPSGAVSTILDLAPVEVARQLTLMRFETFRQIKPKELCNLAWTKKDAVRRSPNVVQFIKNFNKIGQWVTTTVLFQSDPSQRRKVLKHFLSIASDLRDLQNFEGMMEIIAALGSSSITRLRKTWNSKLSDKYKQFEKLIAKNFKELRELVAGALPPCIPYIGVYFTDLVFIEEGNPNYIPDAPNMINWQKALMSSSIMLQIQRFQAKGYSLFQSVPVHDWLSTSITSAVMTESELYQKSLEVEPREKGSK